VTPLQIIDKFDDRRLLLRRKGLYFLEQFLSAHSARSIPSRRQKGTSRFGQRSALIAVDDSEAALLLERELFDRSALVAVVTEAAGDDPSGLTLAKAAGLIVIVTGTPPADAIDARRLATHEAIAMMERRGVLIGREDQLLEGEGI
jgi:hypothetical protein